MCYSFRGDAHLAGEFGVLVYVGSPGDDYAVGDVPVFLNLSIWEMIQYALNQ